MAARYRKAPPTTPPPASSSGPPPSDLITEALVAEPDPKHHKNAPDTNISQFSVLDVLRVLGGIFLLSSGMSYLVFSGESMTWGYNPWWTRAREWKGLLNQQVHLTDTELLAYDGSDPTKPIYLALNGTIYDVTAGRTTYAPGGSYHFFAGRDAARAFITGCFQEDQTPDLRGVEEMYMPIDPEEDESEAEGDKFKAQIPNAEDPIVEEHRKARAHDKRRGSKLTKAEIKNRHAQELRKARKQVKEGLEHWHALFRGDKGKPYFKVGEVKREKGWLDNLPKRELCEQAKKSRPKRKAGGEEKE